MHPFVSIERDSIMGFITPGVVNLFDRKKTGYKNFPTSKKVYANQNRLFNKFYQKSSLNHQLTELHKSFIYLKKAITRKRETKKMRENLENYILLLHEVSIVTGRTDIYPLSEHDALIFLRELFELEAKQLMKKKFQEASDGTLPSFESEFNSKFELTNGGCILFNTYFSNKFPIELFDRSYYEYDSDLYEEESFNEPKNNKIESQKHAMEAIQYETYHTPQSLTDLPDDILVKIISYSHNIENVSLTCKFLHKFTLSHIEFISYQMMIEKFVRTYRLSNLEAIHDESDEILVSDETHHLNSHTLKVSEIYEEENMRNVQEIISSDFKRDNNGVYHVQRYRNPETLVIVSISAFETPFMTYAIYKSLNIDRVLASSALPDFENAYEKEINSLKDSDDAKIDKSVFDKIWPEFTTTVPFLDEGRPSNLDYIKTGMYVDKLRIVLDLLVLETRFVNKLEEIFYFIVSLCIKILETSTVDKERSIIPVDILKNYGVFYMKQNQTIEEENANTEEDLDSEILWDKISFKSPEFYSKLRKSADKELESLLTPLFHKTHICDDLNFWTVLHHSNHDDLIDDIINNHSILPSSHVLNSLMF